MFTRIYFPKLLIRKNMKQDHFNELTVACQKEKGITDQTLLEIGEAIWFAGSPAPADKGTIALRTDTCTLILKEKDVLETMKDGNNYLVKIKLGTSVIYRIENVVEARPGRCGCKDKEDDNQTNGNTSIARTTNEYVRPCIAHVHWWLECFDWKDKNGVPHRICIPLFSITTECFPKVTVIN
jgi:hypothetical protein